MDGTGAERHRRTWAYAALAGWLVAAPAAAQADLRPYAPGTPQYGIGGTSNAPTPAVLRQNEDWSFLAERSVEDLAWPDRLRHVPLATEGRVFARLGFEGEMLIVDPRRENRVLG